MAPFQLSADQRAGLRAVARSTARARVLRRAQALLWLARGDRPGDVAARLGVSRQTLYNWAERFRARRDRDPEHRLDDGPRSGRPPTARGVIDPLLLAVLDDDPRHWGYTATTWTAPLLQQFLREAHDTEVGCQSVRAALARLGFRWKRPRHRLARRPAAWRQAKGG
jgi:transposase